MLYPAFAKLRQAGPKLQQLLVISPLPLATPMTNPNLRAGDGPDNYRDEPANYQNISLTAKRAGDEVRTRDLQLGRLSLYQLSYSRLLTVSGERRIRTFEGIHQQIYSLSSLAA